MSPPVYAPIDWLGRYEESYSHMYCQPQEVQVLTSLQVRYMEKYEFRPAEIVTDICTIYTHLSANPSFCFAVSSDGRCYSPQLFSQAFDVLCKKSWSNPEIILK